MRTLRLAIAVPLLASCTMGGAYTSSDDTPPVQSPDAGMRIVHGPPSGAPISGGTMIATRDGRWLVIGDSDRDQIVSVDMTTRSVASTVVLATDDEPGRLVEDGTGRVHVVLRRAGAIVTIVPGQTQPIDRADVCPEPRGIAWQEAGDLIHVACAGGELVSLPAAGGAELRRVRLDPDLRDVVVSGDTLLVSRFRSAGVLTVDAQGQVIARAVMPEVPRTVFPQQMMATISTTARAEVAYRMIAGPNGSVVMVHQRHVLAALETQQPGGYGGGCGPMTGGGPVESVVSTIAPGMTVGAPLQLTSVPVDVSESPDGTALAVAGVGEGRVHIVPTAVLDDPSDPCMMPPPSELGEVSGPNGTPPTSVLFLAGNHLAVLYPDVPEVRVYTPAFSDEWFVVLPGDTTNDGGRTVFHEVTSSGLACASCHPEGHDDGQVWSFTDLGDRRTQDVGGHILGRAPYHWSGDIPDLASLMQVVFLGRMGGAADPEMLEELGAWLETVPALKPSLPVDRDAVERGKWLFRSSELACSGCHGGRLYSYNLILDVGTGGKFKTPSLRGLAARAPYLHDGCAVTLAGRFSPACGGGDHHGHTSQLSRAQIDDLVAYLETL